MAIPLLVLPVLTVAAALAGDVLSRLSKVDEGDAPAPQPPPRRRPPAEEQVELVGRLLEEILPVLQKDFADLGAAIDRGSVGTARDEADSVLIDYGVLVETLHDLELTQDTLFHIVAKASAKEDRLRESIDAVHAHLARSNLHLARYELDQVRRWLPALVASLEMDLVKVVAASAEPPVDPADVRRRFDIGLAEMVAALGSILELPRSYLDTIREEGTAFDVFDLTLIEAHDVLERWAQGRRLPSFGKPSMPWPMHLVLLRRGSEEMIAASDDNARSASPVADLWADCPEYLDDFDRLGAEIRGWHARFFDKDGRPRPTPLPASKPAPKWKWEVVEYDGTSLAEYDGFDHDDTFVMNPFFAADGTGNRVPDPYDEAEYGWNPAFLDFMRRHPDAREEIGHDSGLVYRDVTSTSYEAPDEESWNTKLVEALVGEGIRATVTDVGQGSYGVEVPVRDDRGAEFARMKFWPLDEGGRPVGIELDYVDDDMPVASRWKIESPQIRVIATEEDLGLVAEWTGEVLAGLRECYHRDVSPDDPVSPLLDIASVRLRGDPETEAD